MVLDQAAVTDKSSSWPIRGEQETGRHRFNYGWETKESRHGDMTYNYLDTAYNGSAVYASAGGPAQKVRTTRKRGVMYDDTAGENNLGQQ